MPYGLGLAGNPPAKAGARSTPQWRWQVAALGTCPAGSQLYNWAEPLMYVRSMDVPVTELRAHLSEWLDRVRGGEEVIVTDRGVPVARMLGMSATAALQRLAADGVIGRDASARRPTATGRSRPRPRQSVSDIVSRQRG
jgi:prevent-host-death family protein